VPDLGPARANVSLFWLCVRIHERLALPVGDKGNWDRGKLKDYGKNRHGHHGFVVK